MENGIYNSLSIISLLISFYTVWATLWDKGAIKMVRPTQIYLGPDGPRSKYKSDIQKIYIRSMIYNTTKIGRIIGSMYVRVGNNGLNTHFDNWVMGPNALAKSCGLFVDRSGNTDHHHFLLQHQNI